MLAILARSTASLHAPISAPKGSSLLCPGVAHHPFVHLLDLPKHSRHPAPTHHPAPPGIFTVRHRWKTVVVRPGIVDGIGAQEPGRGRDHADGAALAQGEG